MAGYGGKGGGYGAGMGAAAGYGTGGCASPGYGAGNMGRGGATYPLALANQGNALYSGKGANGIMPYGQMGNGMKPYGAGGMIGSGMQYSSNMGAEGIQGGMNIAMLVQTTMGTYSFFVGADGRAGMNVPGASFMYTPNNAIQMAGAGRGTDTIDSRLASYGSGGFGGPGMSGYDALKHQMPDLKDLGQADYKMRDPAYASNRIPEKKGSYANNWGWQDGIMKKDPKQRYNEIAKQGSAKTAIDGYGVSDRALPRIGQKNEQRTREPSQLERVAMELPANGYQALPLGV